MIRYLCSWCGQLVDDQNGVESIDPGTILTCSDPECEGDTVVELLTPEERATLHKRSERIESAPRKALMALCDPNSVLCSRCALMGHPQDECVSCTGQWARFQMRVARWLYEIGD